jgi:mRNA interferase MazF
MTSPTLPEPKRGEIWWVDLEPTRGDEIRKTRPAVVVSADTIGRLRLRIVVPITDWKERYATLPWIVPLDPDPTSGLAKPSAADAFQIRSVSLDRMVARAGVLPDQVLDAITMAVALCIRHRPKS